MSCISEIERRASAIQVDNMKEDEVPDDQCLFPTLQTLRNATTRYNSSNLQRSCGISNQCHIRLSASMYKRIFSQWLNGIRTICRFFKARSSVVVATTQKFHHPSFAIQILKSSQCSTVSTFNWKLELFSSRIWNEVVSCLDSVPIFD